MAKKTRKSKQSIRPRQQNNTVTPLQASQPQPKIQSILRQAQALHAGPIPAPEQLEGYEIVSAGAADRIITMAENQQNSRIEYQVKEQEGRYNERRLGQIFAFVICLVIIATVYQLAMHDKPWVAAILGGTGIAGVITAFRKNYSEKPGQTKPKPKS